MKIKRELFEQKNEEELKIYLEKLSLYEEGLSKDKMVDLLSSYEFADMETKKEKPKREQKAKIVTEKKVKVVNPKEFEDKLRVFAQKMPVKVSEKQIQDLLKNNI